MVRVKICGIKRKQDALLACQCGADAIGVLVGRRHTSEDFISEQQAREIVAALPPLVVPVLVTHVVEVEEICRLFTAEQIGCLTCRTNELRTS